MRTPGDGSEDPLAEGAVEGAAGAQGPVEDGDGVDLPVDGPETVAEKRLLATLGKQAEAVNLARVLRLVELLDAADAGRLDEVGRQEAENVAHQLIGSAGTFGHHSASEDAVVVEGFFAARRARRALAVGPDEVRRTLNRLRSEFNGPR